MAGKPVCNTNAVVTFNGTTYGTVTPVTPTIVNDYKFVKVDGSNVLNEGTSITVASFAAISGATGPAVGPFTFTFTAQQQNCKAGGKAMLTDGDQSAAVAVSWPGSSSPLTDTVKAKLASTTKVLAS